MKRPFFLISSLFLVVLAYAYSYDVRVEKGKYKIDYFYYDNFDNRQYFSTEFDVEKTNEMIVKYEKPLDKKLLNLRFTYSNEQEKKEILLRYKNMVDSLYREHFYTSSGNTYSTCDSMIINYFTDYGWPIAEHIFKTLNGLGRDTRQNRIDMAMRFVQSMPYGIPKNTRNELFSPAQVLINGYGDCDSKSLLFAAVIQYLLVGEDILLVSDLKEGHTMVFLWDPKKIADDYIDYQGRRYGICEVSGPARFDFGDTDEVYSVDDIVVIEPYDY